MNTTFASADSQDSLRLRISSNHTVSSDISYSSQRHCRFCNISVWCLLNVWELIPNSSKMNQQRFLHKVCHESLYCKTSSLVLRFVKLHAHHKYTHTHTHTPDKVQEEFWIRSDLRETKCTMLTKRRR